MSFQKAIQNGYGIELDVRLTKDDKLVVFHDDSLKECVAWNAMFQNVGIRNYYSIRCWIRRQIPLLKMFCG